MRVEKAASVPTIVCYGRSRKGYASRTARVNGEGRGEGSGDDWGMTEGIVRVDMGVGLDVRVRVLATRSKAVARPRTRRLRTTSPSARRRRRRWEGHLYLAPDWSKNGGYCQRSYNQSYLSVLACKLIIFVCSFVSTNHIRACFGCQPIRSACAYAATNHVLHDGDGFA